MRSALLAVLGSAAAILCCVAPLPADAQDPAGAEASAESGAAEAQARLAELETQIERLAANAAEWQAKASEYVAAQAGVEERLAELDAEIAALRAGGPGPAVDDATLEQLEVLALGAEQDLAQAQRDASDLQAEHDRRNERRRALPELLAEAKSRLAGLDQASPPAAETEPALGEARRRLAQQRRAALESEVRAYEQELLSYEPRGRLLEGRLALATARAAEAEARLERLREVLTARRKGEAERDAERALASLEDAESLAPVVRDLVRRLAEENARLAQSRTGERGLLEAIEEVSRKLTRADQRLSEVEADTERLSYKVESAGLTDSTGLLLRKMRSELPDVGKYRRFIRMRQEEIGAVEARQEELRDEIAALSDTDAIVAGTLERLDVEAGSIDRDRLEALLRDLLETKRKHLTALLEDTEIYFQKLVDFDARQQELIGKTEALLRFIDQRILWVPSGSALRPKLLRDAVEGLGWLSTPRYWGQLGRALADAALQAPLSNLGVALLLVLSVPLGRRWKRRLKELAGLARAPTHVAVGAGFEALGLSLALAFWVPAALTYLGWRLGVSPDATQFVRCVAHGLFGAGLTWLSLEVPRQLLRRDGLAEAHFAWPEQAVGALRRRIAGIAAVVVPLVFVIQLYEMRAEDDWRESIGRAALLAVLIALVVFTHRVLREGGPLRTILRSTPEIRIGPGAWRMLHAAAVTLPLLLAAGAARGYYWTALQLGSRYHLTLVFLFGLLVLFHFALHWTLLARRRLAFEKWRDEGESDRRPGAEGTDEQPVIANTELDLATVDAQTRRLLSTSAVVAVVLGLWVLWADLLPAVGILDSVELWSASEVHTVETVAADGTAQFVSEERVVPVTLADLLLALVLAFMTLVLVRNLPGMLEISLFRQLGTGTGERYAIASIAKYALTLVGAVFAANAVGIGWSNIQWLVAAVGLGLGFGLQEIFANFVSGLIILFERPIRVGDTVTVGNISGTVSKIRIRATWITGFDRKELVVPNKEFVTNQLVNWSLSDPVLRVDIRVGIAYGSDTELAIRELLRVAQANQHVLRDPKPQVFFVGFGDSALDFELRVFSPDVEHRLVIVHQLHLEVDRAFRAAGIEIAFPQRDLHLRSVPPGQTPPGPGQQD